MHSPSRTIRSSLRCTRHVALLLAAAGALAPAARAATLYWDGLTSGWDAVGNWSTDAANPTPDPLAVPGAGDIAFFNISSVTGPETISLNGPQSALGLVFGNTGTTTLQGGIGDQTLTLGGGGIVINAGAGAVTIGSLTVGQAVNLNLTATEVWTNNSAALLTVNNSVTDSLGLTVNGTGSTNILGVIGGGGGLTKSDNGVLTLSGTNTYTGGTAVLAGTLILAAAAPSGAAGTLGNATSAVLVGDTSGSASAALLTSAAVTVARPLSVQGGSTGAATIGSTGAIAATYSGTVALNKGANFSAATGGTTTFTGIVSGGGGITKTDNGIVVLSAANTYTGGTIVNAGTLRATVAGAFGTNNTPNSITLAGGTLELFNSTNTTFTSSGTTVIADSTVIPNRAASAATTTAHTLGTLTIGAQKLTVTRGGNITGTATGNLTFGATTLTGNATFAPAANTILTLGAVAGAFTLTQAGAGTTILAAAGSYTGGTTLSAGILQLNNATSAGTAPSIDYPNSGSGRLRVNGGVTINYALNIGTGQAGAVGEGLVQQVGNGQANVNGIITLGGIPTAGGVFVGGLTPGNELVVNGALNGGTFGGSQRDGRVIYKGGGTLSSSSATTGLFGITNTAMVGATNGIPTGLSLQLGGSGSATLELNGFDQTLAGLVLGNSTAANNNQSTINLGARTLTLTGDIGDFTTTTANVTHVFNATAGGALNLGAAPRTITVTDSLAGEDVIINNAALNGGGGIIKAGAGTLALRGNTVAGPIAVNAGTLSATNVTAPSITVADNATLNSESTFPTATLGTAVSSNLIINGATPGAFTATTLTVNGNVNVDFALAPASTATPITVLNYGTVVGALNFSLNNSFAYRPGAAFDTATPGTVKLSLVTKDLTWTSASGVVWDNISPSWNDSLAQPDTFFSGDTVTFNDDPVSTSISVTGGVAPFKTTVNSAFNNFTFTSTGAGLSGAGGLQKLGTSTLTLNGTNSYSGPTSIGGGILNISTANSLGNGGPFNRIALSNGAQINYNGTVAIDFGVNRGIDVGTGGGTIAHNTATAVNLTISGGLTGNASAPLRLTSASTAAGNFILTGDNSGFTGAISVEAASTGITTLAINAQQAVPAGGSITINYPPNGATGNATSLNLPGNLTLPSTLALNFTSLQITTPTAISLRTQISAAGSNTINGPITIAGSAIVQFLPTSANGVLTINGPISAGPGGFTGVFFPRSNGTTIFNGVINLPNGTFSRTDAGIAIVNSTGNVWAATGTVSSGILKIGANNALPMAAPLTIGQASDNAASLFDLNGFNQELQNIIYQPGSGNSARAITNSTATLSTLTINNPSPVTYGASTGTTGGLLTGNLALVKTGASTLQLGGANSFTGGTTINQGTLIITADNNLGAVPGAASTNLTINGGTLQENTGFNMPTNRQIALGAGGATFVENATANFNIGGVIKDVTPGAGGPLFITATNTGAYVPVAQNTYSGGTHLGAGATAIVNSSSIGSASDNTLVSGPYGTGTLFFDGAKQRAPTIAGTWLVGNAVQITADSTFIATSTNVLNFTGPVTLVGGTRTLVTNSVGNVIFSGAIGDGGNGYGLALGLGSTNTIVLSGANTYTGGTTVAAGTLQTGASNVIPDTGTVSVDGTLNLSNNVENIAALTGGGTGVVQLGGGSLTTDSAASTAFAGTLSGNVVSTFTKQGTGTLTLSGNSGTTFTGTVLVNGGALVVEGSLSGSSTMLLNPGGTLSGSGTVGPVMLSGGTLAPGGFFPVLNTGAVTFGGGALAIKITNAITYNQANVTGGVAFTGDNALALDFSTYDPLDSVDSFTIVSNDSNDPVSLVNGSLIYGSTPLLEGTVFTATSGSLTQFFRISYAGGDGNDIVLTAVPEPGTAWALAGGLGVLLARRRRRR